MEDKELELIFSSIKRYLDLPKSFMPDVERLAEVQAATETAKALFPNANVTLNHDTLGTGAIFLRIEDYDFTVLDTEMQQFFDLFDSAVNFEIYSTETQKCVISIGFQNVFVVTTQE